FHSFSETHSSSPFIPLISESLLPHSFHPIPHHYTYTLERLRDARPVSSPSHGRWHHICSQRVNLEHWLLRPPTPSSVYHFNMGESHSTSTLNFDIIHLGSSLHWTL